MMVGLGILAGGVDGAKVTAPAVSPEACEQALTRFGLSRISSAKEVLRAYRWVVFAW